MGDQGLDAVLEVPAVRVIDPRQQFRSRARRLAGAASYSAIHSRMRRAPSRIFACTVRFAVQVEYLRQVAGHQIAPPDDLAGVRLHRAGDDLEEGGFSRAIAAQQADALALVDDEGGLIEDASRLRRRRRWNGH